MLKVAAAPPSPKVVSFGCWVGYEDENGDTRCYQLVGPDEIDVSAGKISIDSPVGQALLHKRLDDEVFIKRPTGDLTVYITSINQTRPQGI